MLTVFVVAVIAAFVIAKYDHTAFGAAVAWLGGTAWIVLFLIIAAALSLAFALLLAQIAKPT